MVGSLHRCSDAWGECPRSGPGLSWFLLLWWSISRQLLLYLQRLLQWWSTSRAPAVITARAPVMEYVAPIPAVTAARASVVEFTATARALIAARAPAVEYTAPTPAGDRSTCASGGQNLHLDRGGTGQRPRQSPSVGGRCSAGFIGVRSAWCRRYVWRHRASSCCAASDCKRSAALVRGFKLGRLAVWRLRCIRVGVVWWWHQAADADLCLLGLGSGFGLNSVVKLLGGRGAIRVGVVWLVASCCFLWRVIRVANWGVWDLSRVVFWALVSGLVFGRHSSWCRLVGEQSSWCLFDCWWHCVGNRCICDCLVNGLWMRGSFSVVKLLGGWVQLGWCRQVVGGIVQAVAVSAIARQIGL